MSTDRDRRIARNIERWFEAEMRPLPWRTEPRDPYRSLVSEFMLQQTQTSRVIEKFDSFVKRFPTVRALASAHTDDVLAMWSGLGYYRRANSLHKTAIQIVKDHDGIVPADVRTLLTLPGVGRYTAGAISSIVFKNRVPIVDGNVARVILRIDGTESPPDDPATARTLWTRAQELVQACERPARLNEGLMELGAIVCTPANPSCDACPVSRSCVAKHTGSTRRIPVPKKRARQREHHIAMALIRDPRGRVLVEQRSNTGLWAGLWQGPSIESPDAPPTKRVLEALVGFKRLRRHSEFRHITTHRIIRFVTYSNVPDHVPDRGFSPVRGSFKSPTQIQKLALSSIHRRLLCDSPGPVLNKH